MLEYSNYLVLKYNIMVNHQVPWSPETNMLDLGSWMIMQSKVKNTTAATSKNKIPLLGPLRRHGETWRHRNSPMSRISYLRSCISPYRTKEEIVWYKSTGV